MECPLCGPGSELYAQAHVLTYLPLLAVRSALDVDLGDAEVDWDQDESVTNTAGQLLIFCDQHCIIAREGVTIPQLLATIARRP